MTRRMILAGCAGIPGLLAAQKRDLAQLQEKFLKLRFGLFLHFNMGTFAGREWATGYEDPALFHPDKLDCSQWAGAAEAAGMRYAVLTVKHTGGWCLWDSRYTTHDVTAFRRYKNGKGDIVRAFVDAFRRRGLGVGLYYCFPGDFAGHKTLGHPIPRGSPDLHGLPPEAAGDYAGFMKKQLAELLTGYGPIDLLWIDQYRNKYTVARWQEIKSHLHSVQPECVVIGNNAATLLDSDILSYEFPWKPDRLPPEGNTVPSEICDTLQKSIWFWRPFGPGDLKRADEVVCMLRLSNSRRANYLLNVPPDKHGLISGPHLERMQEIGRLLK
jgi:alpha-L-fucosidase